MKNTKKKPIVLCIMDGWGINENTENNAVALAKTPNVDFLTKTFPYSTLDASVQMLACLRSSRKF